MIEQVRGRRIEVHREIRRLARHRPTHRHAVAGADHGRHRERHGALSLDNRVPVIVQNGRDARDGADGDLAERLVCRRIGGHVIHRLGRLIGAGQRFVQRRRHASRLEDEIVRGPFAVRLEPVRPGHDLLQEIVLDLDEALIVAFGVARKARFGIIRRHQLSVLVVARIVRLHRDIARLVFLLHLLRLQRGKEKLALLEEQRAALALVGDGVHHVQHLLERDIGIDLGDGRLEAGEFAHRMAAGDEIVEHVVLLHRRLRIKRVPQRAAVGIFRLQIGAIAAIHVADGTEERQRVALLPIVERDFGEVFLLRPRLQKGLRFLFRFFDRDEKLDRLPVERADIHRNLVVGQRVLQVDDVRDGGFVRAVAGPAVEFVLQRGPGEDGRHADRGRHVGGKLQMDHLLHEDRKDDVECLFIGGLRRGRRRRTRPLPAGIEVVAGRRDLMEALDRVKRGHVERDGEQLDLDRGLRDRGDRRDVGVLQLGIAADESGFVGAIELRQQHGSLRQIFGERKRADVGWTRPNARLSMWPPPCQRNFAGGLRTQTIFGTTIAQQMFDKDATRGACGAP